MDKQLDITKNGDVFWVEGSTVVYLMAGIVSDAMTYWASGQEEEPEGIPETDQMMCVASILAAVVEGLSELQAARTRNPEMLAVLAEKLLDDGSNGDKEFTSALQYVQGWQLVIDFEEVGPKANELVQRAHAFAAKFFETESEEVAGKFLQIVFATVMTTWEVFLQAAANEADIAPVISIALWYTTASWFADSAMRLALNPEVMQRIAQIAVSHDSDEINRLFKGK